MKVKICLLENNWLTFILKWDYMMMQSNRIAKLLKCMQNKWMKVKLGKFIKSYLILKRPDLKVKVYLNKDLINMLMISRELCLFTIYTSRMSIKISHYKIKSKIECLVFNSLSIFISSSNNFLNKDWIIEFDKFIV